MKTPPSSSNRVKSSRHVSWNGPHGPQGRISPDSQRMLSVRASHTKNRRGASIAVSEARTAYLSERGVYPSWLILIEVCAGTAWGRARTKSGMRKRTLCVICYYVVVWMPGCSRSSPMYRTIQGRSIGRSSIFGQIWGADVDPWSSGPP